MRWCTLSTSASLLHGMHSGVISQACWMYVGVHFEQLGLGEGATIPCWAAGSIILLEEFLPDISSLVS